MTSSYITSIGTSLPENRFSQQEVADFMISHLSLEAHEARWLNQVYQASGIEHRHSVLPDFSYQEGNKTLFSGNEHDPADSTSTTQSRMELYRQNAISLAKNATQKAFEDRQEVKPQEITHLITVSCTGFYAPGLDIDLIESTGLNPTIERTGIHFMGCYAVFNALKTARHIIRSQPEAKVLLVAVELCSLHFQNSKDKNQLITGALFSDGAGAAIIESQPGESGISLENAGFHCSLAPDSREAMTWEIGDEGFLMHLSGSVPGHIQKTLKPTTDELLAQTGITYDQIPELAAHPGGIKILDAIENELNYHQDQNWAARKVLKEYGNMSSPTILFVLQNFMQGKQANANDDYLLSMAFGPGLTLETGLFRIHSPQNA